jgi:hypothetical protein
VIDLVIGVHRIVCGQCGYSLRDFDRDGGARSRGQILGLIARFRSSLNLMWPCCVRLGTLR